MNEKTKIEVINRELTIMHDGFNDMRNELGKEIPDIKLVRLYHELLEKFFRGILLRNAVCTELQSDEILVRLYHELLENELQSDEIEDATKKEVNHE